MTIEQFDDDTRQALEAEAFRTLLRHLRDHPEVQNIDLMNLAGFCRNCLSKYLVGAASARDLSLDYDAAREYVYGMPYAEWKATHQQAATPEQSAAYAARHDG